MNGTLVLVIFALIVIALEVKSYAISKMFNSKSIVFIGGIISTNPAVTGTLMQPAGIIAGACVGILFLGRVSIHY